jgi:hypothetical protein
VAVCTRVGAGRLHCSGRQNCKHMLATWQLRRRQDLWSLLWELYYPGRDLLKVNVAMNDTAMEPMVLVAGRANPVRDLRRDMPEVDKYTERVKASPDRRKPWVANNVVVWSEVLRRMPCPAWHPTRALRDPSSNDLRRSNVGGLVVMLRTTFAACRAAR